jgi:hypothetical protein
MELAELSTKVKFAFVIVSFVESFMVWYSILIIEVHNAQFATAPLRTSSIDVFMMSMTRIYNDVISYVIGVFATMNINHRTSSLNDSVT